MFCVKKIFFKKVSTYYCDLNDFMKILKRYLNSQKLNSQKKIFESPLNIFPVIFPFLRLIEIYIKYFSLYLTNRANMTIARPVLCKP